MTRLGLSTRFDEPVRKTSTGIALSNSGLRTRVVFDRLSGISGIKSRGGRGTLGGRAGIVSGVREPEDTADGALGVWFGRGCHAEGEGDGGISLGSAGMVTVDPKDPLSGPLPSFDSEDQKTVSVDA